MFQRFTRNSNQLNKFLRIYSTNISPAEEPTSELDKLYKIVELELKGNDPAVLKSFAHFATLTGNNLNIECKTYVFLNNKLNFDLQILNSSWNLRKPLHERFTVLKSIHIYKKHRVQYEFRTYFTFVQYKHLTGSTADTLLEYIERNLPEGVALKATKVCKIFQVQQYNEYDFLQVELQKVPEHFTPPSKDDSQESIINFLITQF